MYIVLTDLRPIFTAPAIFLMSLDMRATSADSMATAEPSTPIAIPTSAAANAGASLIPSPTMAVIPSLFSSPINLSLSSGSNWA